MSSKNVMKSFAALSVSMLTLVPTGWAADLKLSEADATKLAQLNSQNEEMKRDELSYVSDVDPFPTTEVSPVDPLTKKKMQHVVVGPAFKTRAYSSNYDYYRYVTYYNVTYRKERIYDLPIQREQCYEKSEIFGNYNSSKTYTATVTASASLEGLGLNASMSAARTFSTGHGIVATGGIVADYTPYTLRHDWQGHTLIQLLNSKTGKVDFLKKATKGSPWWVTIFFPILSQTQYPMDFQIIGADRTFMVDRDIIEVCDAKFGAP